MLWVYIEQTIVLLLCLIIFSAVFIWVTILPSVGLLYLFGLLP